MKIKNLLTQFNETTLKCEANHHYDLFTLEMVFFDIKDSLNCKEEQKYKELIIEIQNRLDKLDKEKQDKIDKEFKEWEEKSSKLINYSKEVRQNENKF